jgi:hypothetical protein
MYLFYRTQVVLIRGGSCELSTTWLSFLSFRIQVLTQYECSYFFEFILEFSGTILGDVYINS